ncbi:MAG TPA: hypothetical protein VK013_13595 [Myxococcaceae bacterium]|nr:hypothetical protein [Myxococcaceae bacterium]
MQQAGPQHPSDVAAGLEVPELGRMAWMLFFEPVKLFHLLRTSGVRLPGAGLITQLTSGVAPARVYGLRMSLVLLLLAPLLTLMIAGGFGASGILIPRGLLGGVLLSGMLTGVAWAVLANLPFGTSLAIILPLAGLAGVLLLSSGAVPPEPTWLTPALLGGAPGAAAGWVFGPSRALNSGETLTPQRGAFIALLFAFMAALVTADGGTAYALQVAAWLMMGFLLCCFRLVTWPLEALLQLVLSVLERRFGVRTLRFSPVLWHDLSYLPLPGLAAHVQNVARHDPRLAQRVLASCFIAPGQRRIGQALQVALSELDRERLAAPLGP